MTEDPIMNPQEKFEVSLVYYGDGNYPEKDVQKFLDVPGSSLVTQNSLVVVMQGTSELKRTVEKTPNWCISKEKDLTPSPASDFTP